MADMTAALDKGVLTDDEAKAMGFVDEIGYRDVLMDGIRKELVGDKDAEKKLPFYKLSSYAEAIHDENKRAAKLEDKPHVALIYAVGEIASGSQKDSAGMQSGLIPGVGGKIEGDDLSADIRKAARDKDVKIIVMRVNSPGGSPSASETIRRAVVYAKEHGKKVYVSMGGAAASGGYWISTSADRIYALPMTLTGSIGVAGGKFALDDMWQKIGITWDGVSVGKNAGMQSMNYPYNDTQRAAMNKVFDHIYQGFITRVSEGRHMTLAQADKIAQGRVWSGNQGKALGLVDKMGGLDVVLNDVATELGQKDRFGLDVEVWPKPESTIEKISNLLQGQVGMVTNLKTQAGILRLFQPVLDRLDATAQPGINAYEPVRVH
jgi:protease-4